MVEQRPVVVLERTDRQPQRSRSDLQHPLIWRLDLHSKPVDSIPVDRLRGNHQLPFLSPVLEKSAGSDFGNNLSSRRAYPLPRPQPWHAVAAISLIANLDPAQLVGARAVDYL